MTPNELALRIIAIIPDAKFTVWNVPPQWAESEDQSTNRLVRLGNVVCWSSDNINTCPSDDDLLAIVISQDAPKTISRFQAIAALHFAGLLTQVETIMADQSTDILTRLAWQNANEFQRTSPVLVAMSQILGLSEVQLDDLFIQAAKISV